MSDTLEHAVIPVLHDETHHGKWYPLPQVDSMGNCPNLMGYLEHHAPSTDGSFAICIAAGNATLVSKVSQKRLSSLYRKKIS